MPCMHECYVQWLLAFCTAVLATAFYAWVQAKNVHDVEIADKSDVATKYYETKLKRTMLNKWKVSRAINTFDNNLIFFEHLVPRP